MIDKQKLLQWVEEEKNVYSGPYSSMQDQNKCEGSLKVLGILEIYIAAGNLDVEEVAHERSEASSASAART